VPGWMLARSEKAKLTEGLPVDTVAKQAIG
jgi:hypothetical protein